MSLVAVDFKGLMDRIGAAEDPMREAELLYLRSRPVIGETSRVINTDRDRFKQVHGQAALSELFSAAPVDSWDSFAAFVAMWFGPRHRKALETYIRHWDIASCAVSHGSFVLDLGRTMGENFVDRWNRDHPDMRFACGLPSPCDGQFADLIEAAIEKGRLNREGAVPEPEHVDTREAAALLGCTDRHVRRLAGQAQIEARVTPAGVWRCASSSIYLYRRRIHDKRRGMD